MNWSISHFQLISLNRSLCNWNNYQLIRHSCLSMLSKMKLMYLLGRDNCFIGDSLLWLVLIKGLRNRRTRMIGRRGRWSRLRLELQLTIITYLQITIINKSQPRPQKYIHKAIINRNNNNNNGLMMTIMLVSYNNKRNHNHLKTHYQHHSHYFTLETY
jgi:hypothetical protein